MCLQMFYAWDGDAATQVPLWQGDRPGSEVSTYTMPRYDNGYIIFMPPKGGI